MRSLARFFVGYVLLGWVLSIQVLTSASASGNTDEQKLVVIRGRVVCLDQSGAVQECPTPVGRLGLKPSDGGVFKFLESDPMAAMIADPLVRSKELQVTASLKPNNQLEVIKVQAVKQGKVYDLYYFCEICNITAYAPGLCPCCRRELEFKEVPSSEP